MLRSFIAKFLGGVACASLLAVGLYHVPPIHERLSWRMTLVAAYVGGVIHPADQAPTPLPTAQLTRSATRTPSATPTEDSSATARPSPTEAPPTATPTPIPGQVRLEAPDFEKQDINNCGPAALSTNLRYWGWDGDQFSVAEVVKPVREDRNVNVEELVYFVRNHAGWLNIEYRVGGSLEQVRKFIAAGIPVLIEETFHMDEPFWPRDDLWAGHYLLVTGYDDARKVFTTQDTYYGANQAVEYTQLDENWKSFNRVLIVIFRPDQQPIVEGILGADWDVDANRRNALEEARAETVSNPEDAYAWFNLGSNLVYFEEYAEAALAYDTARGLGLPQRMFRYQFGPFLAYFHAGRQPDLLALTEYALERTPNSEEDLLWRGWALYRDGDTNSAAEHFRRALEANPTYTDADYALNFIGQ
jgi:tetratricopeptide (TPR) repeat protein